MIVKWKRCVSPAISAFALISSLKENIPRSHFITSRPSELSQKMPGFSVPPEADSVANLRNLRGFRQEMGYEMGSKHSEVSEDWVIEYHNSVEKVEKELRKNLDDFRVPQKCLKRVEAGGIILPEKKETRYREGLWCDRSIHLQKVDAVLTYLQLLLKPEDRKIGFRE